MLAKAMPLSMMMISLFSGLCACLVHRSNTAFHFVVLCGLAYSSARCFHKSKFVKSERPRVGARTSDGVAFANLSRAPVRL